MTDQRSSPARLRPHDADHTRAGTTKTQRPAFTGLPWISRVFVVASILEAFTWAGLLAGMFLKYVTETTDVGVRIFGPLHGGMFLLYAVIALVTAVALRWPWWLGALALLAAIPPLVTVPLELVLRRRGRLTQRSASRAHLRC